MLRAAGVIGHFPLVIEASRDRGGALLLSEAVCSCGRPAKVMAARFLPKVAEAAQRHPNLKPISIVSERLRWDYPRMADGRPEPGVPARQLSPSLSLTPTAMRSE